MVMIAPAMCSRIVISTHCKVSAHLKCAEQGLSSESQYSPFCSFCCLYGQEAWCSRIIEMACYQLCARPGSFGMRTTRGAIKKAPSQTTMTCRLRTPTLVSQAQGVAKKRRKETCVIPEFVDDRTLGTNEAPNSVIGDTQGT